MENLSGTVLLQRFRLDQLERQDATGDDYRGLDLKRNIPVLVKVLRVPIPPDPGMLTFQVGNSTLTTMNHRHIVPFFGLFQEGNTSFLVERQVTGASLHQNLIERGGKPFSVEDSLVYLKALCLALGYAQGFGIVHANINPSNIWLDQTGNILLGGFGFARSIDSLMTPTGLAGPPLYAAPEMLRQQNISSASDIYAIGIILFMMLTGSHPFSGPVDQLDRQDYDRVANLQLNQPPPHPGRINPNLPEGLSQVILTALAKSPRERYQSPQEMFEIACAVLGLSTESIHESFGRPSTEVDTMVAPSPWIPQTPAAAMPPKPAPIPQTMQAPTPVVPRTVVAPYPSNVPSTQVVTGPPSSRVIPVEQEYDQPRKNRWLVPALIGLGVIVCLVISGGAAYFLGNSLFASPTPIVLPSLAPTLTPVPATAIATAAPPTAPAPQEFTPISQPGSLASTPTQVILPTIAPTQIPPTATRVPPTPLPPTTPPRTAFTVTIRNNLGYPVYAFRDGQLMGTDPIPPRMYIYYRNISAGVHVFFVCQTMAMQKCQDQRQVNLTEDLTITFP